jgi:hypothetical protein
VVLIVGACMDGIATPCNEVVIMSMHACRIALYSDVCRIGKGHH